MLEVNDQTFKKEVLESDKPVVVDCYADWCMPCKIYSSEFEEASKILENKVKFVKLNVDKAPATARKYEVMSIPTTLLFNKGELKGGIVGALSADDLAEWIKKKIGL